MHVITFYMIVFLPYRRVLFEDPNFPADDRALQIRYKHSPDTDSIDWKRPHVYRLSTVNYIFHVYFRTCLVNLRNHIQQM